MTTTPGAPVTPSMSEPADQATVRRMNLALLMRTVLTDGPRSRAKLAADTGLTKATISSLVTELIDRGLLTEGQVDRGGIGRPGRRVEVDGSSVRCLGLELNIDYIVGVVLDLNGRVVAHRRSAVPLRDLGPAHGLSRVAVFTSELLRENGIHVEQIETLHVSLPGMIDVDSGILSHAPNLHWRQVDVVHTLRGRLGWTGTRIHIDNDANFGAMAEYARGRSAGSRNLLYLVGDVGVGAGLVVDGRILRGHTGFAGEVGHVPLGRPDLRCGCGRLGCWETTVGLEAVLAATAGPAAGQGDLNVALTAVLQQADDGDPAIVEVLHATGRSLGTGAAVLANLLDPEVIILGGHFSRLQRHLVAGLHETLDPSLVGETGPVRVEFSEYGSEAPALGAAHAGIDLIVSDPSRVRSRITAPSST